MVVAVVRDHAWAVAVALAVSTVIVAVSDLIGRGLEALFGWPHLTVAITCGIGLALLAGWLLEATIRMVRADVAHVRRRIRGRP